jgi:AcrR family transcriptional regulator
MTDQSPGPALGADPAKRQRLLEAAAAEFARRGFDRAGVDLIAERAGVGKGTVYLYATNKADLFQSVLTALHERLVAAVAGDVPVDSVAALRAFIRAHLRVADTAPDFFRCYTSALFGVNRDFQDAALVIFAWQRERLAALLTRAGVQEDEPLARRRAGLLAGSVLAAALSRGLQGMEGTATDMEETVLLRGFLEELRPNG